MTVQRFVVLGWPVPEGDDALAAEVAAVAPSCADVEEAGVLVVCGEPPPQPLTTLAITITPNQRLATIAPIERRLPSQRRQAWRGWSRDVVPWEEWASDFRFPDMRCGTS
jgi:hypothetical protein